HDMFSLTTAVVLMTPRTPRSTLFPYTTLFRSTRLQGGKDSASPRYIFTRLDDLTPLMIRTEDDIILERAIDDGIKIEPTVYAPRSEERRVGKECGSRVQQTRARGNRM